MNRQQVADLIRQCLESLNRERPADDRIAISDETLLLYDDSQLDSLQFVAFITDLEGRLAAATGRTVPLIANALTSDEHPFRDVGMLTQYVVKLVAK